MPGVSELRPMIEAAAGGPRFAEIQMAVAGSGGLVAWVESKCDVATLFVAGQGRLQLARSLARSDTSDFGYEGCDARYLAWHGSRVVVVSRERSSCYLRSLDPDGDGEEGLSFPWSWQIDRDLAVWVGDDPGLLCTAALPSLDARPPLPIYGARARGYIRLQLREGGRLEVLPSGQGGTGPMESLALPSERQSAEYAPVEGLLDLVERRLFPSAGAPGDARLVIEALGHPFVCGSVWRKGWEPVPVWLPAYWHRHLKATGREREARELAEVLDGLARELPGQEAEQGWDRMWHPRDGQVELAVRHVRRQAQTLANVCRSGVLPQGWQCLLFDPAPRSEVAGSRVDPAGYSPILRRAFEELARAKPERLTARSR